MTTTTANVWVAEGTVESWELPLPEPPQGGMLLEVTANGICGTDLHLISQQPSKPLVLGHEIVGRIVAFGGGHSQRDAADEPLRVGDSVALFPWLPCLRCWACRRFGPAATTCTDSFVYGIPPEALGLAPLATTATAGPSLTGGFGRHLTVLPGTYLWRVPEHVPATIASLLDPLAVAVRVVDMARTATGTWDEALTPDATAVVLGAGAVGLLVAMTLRAVGVGNVIVSGSRPSRLSAAADIGATTVLDRNALSVDERRTAVMDHTSGRGADLVIDATNQPTALNEAFAMVRRLGTIIEVGNIVSSGVEVALDPARDVCQKNVRLLGVAANPPRSYAEAMALLSRHNEIPFARLITRVHGFDHLDAALEDLAGDSVKVVLTAQTADRFPTGSPSDTPAIPTPRLRL